MTGIVPSACHKNGMCELQSLAYRVGVHDVRFPNTREKRPIDMSSPSIVLDPNKCILCGDCVRTCDEIQGVGAINFAFRGSKTQVMAAFNKKLSETECVGCSLSDFRAFHTLECYRGMGCH